MPRRAAAFLLAALVTVSAPARAGDWTFIDPLLAQALDIRAGEGSAILFPNDADPLSADVALAFFYGPNRAGGNSFGITVGLFGRTGRSWTYLRPVTGLSGTEPRGLVFLNDRIEVTTTTLGPNDPRCCPTGMTRWSVDLSSGVTVRLP